MVAGAAISLQAGLFGFAILRHLGPRYFDFSRGPASLVRGISEFAIGMLTYRFATSHADWANEQPAWIAPGTVLLGLVLLCRTGTDLMVLQLTPVLLLSLVARPNIMDKLLGSGPLEYLGVLSFSIYLWHFLLNPFISFVGSMATRYGLPHAHIIGVAAALIVLAPLSMVSYERLEQPCRLWLRRLFQGRSNPVLLPS